MIQPALICIAAVATIFAQEPVFNVDVRLVRMVATVKDDTGRPVGGSAPAVPYLAILGFESAFAPGLGAHMCRVPWQRKGAPLSARVD